MRVERLAEAEGLGACGSEACRQERLEIQQEAQIAVQEAARERAVSEAQLTAARASEEQVRADNEEWQVRSHRDVVRLYF